MDDEAILAHLAGEVRRRAKQRGLGIDALADLAGISRRGLWQLLAQQHFPTLRTVGALARALECEPGVLLPH